MSQTTNSSSEVWTAVSLAACFGAIPLERVWTHPAPGEATEENVVEICDHRDRLCELIDGVLVEKTVGYLESWLAINLASLLANFVREHDLGIVLGADGLTRLSPGQIRIPDAAFISWDRIPDRYLPQQPFWDRGLDLAVEITSPHNTVQEMDRKLVDYFAAGVRAVWYVYPKSREVVVYSSPTQSITIQENGTLDGSPVLPGFSLPLAELFGVPGH
jgi:Uma2 family endonuclease